MALGETVIGRLLSHANVRRGGQFETAADDGAVKQRDNRNAAELNV